MTDVRVIVDPETLQASGLRPATGCIFLELAEHAFPTAGWNDFVVVVLGTMCNALALLLSGARDSERILLMEGPYAVDLIRGSDAKIIVRAVERRGTDVERSVVATPWRALADQLLSAADRTLEKCRARQHWLRDEEQLETAVEFLRREAAQLMA